MNICLSVLISEIVSERKSKEDYILPLDAKAPKLKPAESDLNTTYDIWQRHNEQERRIQDTNFGRFVRRGQDLLFDHFFFLLEQDADNQIGVLDYLRTINASTDDILELVLKNVATVKEIENYLHQCWRYVSVITESSEMVSEDGSDSDSYDSSSPINVPVIVHAPWCLVCGHDDTLLECPNCPASFHLACRKDWLISVIHRKNPSKKPQEATVLVEKILSSTRTICSLQKEENADLCPSCKWGPRVGYDDVVWHKLGRCLWWPARVLTPGAIPACLLSRSHTADQWPLRYYGELTYSWGDVGRMCLFLPSHTAALDADHDLKEALFDACDDYIIVYLT